ncbi:MAG: hypothetical protein AAF235_01895 [Planctomycetota bacterium]
MFRKLWRSVVFLSIIFIAALIVVTRTDVAKQFVLPRLSASLGLDVTAARLVVTPDLHIVATDAQIQIPGVPGDAATILRIDEIDITPDFEGMLGRRLGVRRVRLTRPTVLLSRNNVTGVFNAEAIEPLSGDASQPPMRLPAILVEGATVRMGEHGAEGVVTELAAITGDGLVSPTADGDGSTLLRIVGSELGQSAMLGGGFEVTGTHGEDGFEARFRNLVLNRFDPALAPDDLRPTIDALDIDGAVEPTLVSWNSDGRVSIELRLRGVALNVPTTDVSSADEPGDALRLTDVTGSITIASDGVQADLRGMAGPIAYDVALDVWGLSGNSPFLSRLRARPFRLEEDLSLLRFAPGPVAENIARFSNPTAVIEAEVWLAQGAPPNGRHRISTARFPADRGLLDNAARGTGVRVRGEMLFRDGVARYRGFPYPFENLRGSIVFTRDRLELREIVGVSRSGAMIRANGVVTPLGPTAGVTLDITVRDLKLDDVLREALSGPQLESLDRVFSTPAYNRLVDEGFVRSASEIADLRSRRTQIDAQLRAWTAMPGIAVSERQKLLDERAAIDAAFADVPAFDFGSTATASVNVTRQIGFESIWTRDIRISMPRVGMVPEDFPVPVVGENLELRIEDGGATLHATGMRTLSGGDIELDAVIPFGDEDGGGTEEFDTEDPRAGPTLDIAIRGRDVPIDAMLIRAIPEPDGMPTGPEARGFVRSDGPRTAPSEAPSEAPFSVRDLLRDIDIQGTVSTEARINRGVTGKLQLQIEINDIDARARVLDPSGDPSLFLDNIAGVVVLDEREAVLGITSDVRETRQNTGSTDPASSTAPSETAFYATIGLEDPSESDEATERPLLVDVVARRLEAHMPIEDGLTLFAPELAERIRGLREAFEPDGRLLLSAAYDRGRTPGLDPTTVTLLVRDIEDLRLRTEQGRVRIANTEGHAAFTSSPSPRISFAGFEASVALDDEEAGRLRIDNWLSLSPETPFPLIGAGLPSLRIRLDDARFEAPLTRRIASQRLGPGPAKLFDTYDPAGVFDIEFFLARTQEVIDFDAVAPGSTAATSREDGPDAVASSPASANPPFVLDDVLGALRAYGGIRPRSLAITTDAGRLVLPTMTGVIRFEEHGGSFEDLIAESEGPADGAPWRVALRGSWETRDATGLTLDAQADLTADSYPAALLPALPVPLVDGLEALEVGADGPVRIDNAMLTLHRAPEATSWAFDASGAVDVERGTINVGIPLSGVHGRFRFEASGDPNTPGSPRDTPGIAAGGPSPRAAPRASTEPRFSISFGDAAFTAVGTRLRGVEGRVERGEQDGDAIFARGIRGHAHGGIITAEATVIPETAATPATPGGVEPETAAPGRYEAKMRATDISLASLIEGNISLADAQPMPRLPSDISRGRVNAEASVSGTIGETADRTGRGSLSAAGGTLVSVPLLVPLLEFSNLQVPTGSRLDRAAANFFISGDTVTFDAIDVSTESVRVLGYGEATLPEGQLDLRFRSFGSMRIPVVSEILEAVRDEIILTRVTGTIAEPKIGSDSFSATRRIIASLLGGETDPDLERLRRLEDEARSLRRRSGIDRGDPAPGIRPSAPGGNP